MKTSILALLLPTLFIGCISQDPVDIANRTFPHQFHGEYFVNFSADGKVVLEEPTTWYDQFPRHGRKTLPGQMPPTRVRRGMSVSEVESILGRHVSRRGNQYCYWIR